MVEEEARSIPGPTMMAQVDFSLCLTGVTGVTGVTNPKIVRVNSIDSIP